VLCFEKHKNLSRVQVYSIVICHGAKPRRSPVDRAAEDQFQISTYSTRDYNGDYNGIEHGLMLSVLLILRVIVLLEIIERTHLSPNLTD